MQSLLLQHCPLSKAQGTHLAPNGLGETQEYLGEKTPDLHHGLGKDRRTALYTETGADQTSKGRQGFSGGQRTTCAPTPALRSQEANAKPAAQRVWRAPLSAPPLCLPAALHSPPSSSQVARPQSHLVKAALAWESVCCTGRCGVLMRTLAAMVKSQARCQNCKPAFPGTETASGPFARPGPVVPNSQPLWAVSKPWSNTTPLPCVSLTTAPPWEFHGDVLLKGMRLVGGGGLGWGLLFCCSVMSGFFATLQTAAQWGRVLIKRRAPHPHALHPF